MDGLAKRVLEDLPEGACTPFYLLDLDGVERALTTLRNAWEEVFGSVGIAYSFKTNSLSSLTRRLRALGCMAEVVSGTELGWALRDGFSDILFDGPVKTQAELCDRSG